MEDDFFFFFCKYLHPVCPVRVGSFCFFRYTIFCELTQMAIRNNVTLVYSRTRGEELHSQRGQLGTFTCDTFVGFSQPSQQQPNA
jgi:hypothetical protein